MTSPEQTPITDRLQACLDVRVSKDGTISKVPRKYAKGERRSERQILSEIFSVVRRPVDVDDITPEMSEFLIKRWHTANVRPVTIRIRLKWFERVNLAGVAFGITEPKDFSRVSPLRRTDWGNDFRAIAEPAPEPKRRGKPSALKAKLDLLKFLQDHYVPERLTGRSDNTVRLYKITIRAFGKFLGRPAILGDFNTQSVSKFLQFCLSETNLAPATVEKHRTQITALWNFAAKKGCVAEFPTLNAINVPRRVPDSWTDAEVQAIFQACEQQKGFVGRIPANAFWLALLSVVFDTAERIGALMETEWSSLDSAGALTVRGEHRKGGKRDKRFRLQTITVERLHAIKRYGEKKLFPWPYCSGYLWRKFGKLIEDAGLPNSRRNKFHKVRRTVASTFEAAGGNATELLDHQARKTTKHFYLDPGVIRQTQPADVLPAFGTKLKQEVSESLAAVDPTTDEASETLARIKELLGSLQSK